MQILLNILSHDYLEHLRQNMQKVAGEKPIRLVTKPYAGLWSLVDELAPVLKHIAIPEKVSYYKIDNGYELFAQLHDNGIVSLVICMIGSGSMIFAILGDRKTNDDIELVWDGAGKLKNHATIPYWQNIGVGVDINKQHPAKTDLALHNVIGTASRLSVSITPLQGDDAKTSTNLGFWLRNESRELGDYVCARTNVDAFMKAVKAAWYAIKAPKDKVPKRLSISWFEYEEDYLIIRFALDKKLIDRKIFMESFSKFADFPKEMFTLPKLKEAAI